MRRILLTSSQVSVLVTTFVGKLHSFASHKETRRTKVKFANHDTLFSSIVLSCTVALFLSGYAIQQRTLRQLRTAIQKPRVPKPKPNVYLPEKFRKTKVLEDGTSIDVESQAERERREQREDQEQVIEVKPTLPETSADDRGKQGTGASKQQQAMVASLQAQVAQKSWGVEHPDPLSNNKLPVTRAERRRLIKEEMTRLSRSDEKIYYQPRLW